MPRGTGRLDRIRQKLSTLTEEELQQIRQPIQLQPTIEEESDSDTIAIPPPTSTSNSPPRFVHWTCCLIFSIITMTSATVISKNDDVNQSSSFEKWGIILPAVTLALSGISVLLYLIPCTTSLIEDRMLEGLLVVVMIIFWATAVSIITNPKYGIAVNEHGNIVNGNVYYFSWAGFVSSITLKISYLRSAFGVDVVGEIQSRSARLNHWAALLATSIVVMSSSSTIFASQCIGRSHSASNMYCVKTLYGVALGSGSSFTALLMVIIKMALSRVPFLVEAVSSFLLVPYYIFGVAIITHHNDGPGASLGNLYYFIWLSFIISYMLAADCLEEWFKTRNAKAASLSNSSSTPTGHDLS